MNGFDGATDDTLEAEGTAQPSGATGRQPRHKSTIAFPYVNLEDAIAVARIMKEEGGGPFDRDEIAVKMGQQPTSGSYLVKVSAAKLYGLIEIDGKKLKLTNRALDVLSANSETALRARSEAFLAVPLYKAIYDKFRGQQLPARPRPLEEMMIDLGISPKQGATARLVFDHSAKFAGFYKQGDDRLVAPESVEAEDPPESPKPPPEEQKPMRQANETAASDPKLDPLMQGMLERLPAAGTKWAMEKRRKWLQIFAANLGLIYEIDEVDSDKEISVSLRTEKQN